MSEVKLLSDRGKHLRTSPTFAIASRVRELEQQGKKVINFGLGHPPSLLKLMTEEMRSRIHFAFQDTFHRLSIYYPAAGLVALREKVSDYFVTYTKEETIITGDGGKGALEAALFVSTNPGDKIILPIPCWPTHIDLIEDLGCEYVPMPTYDTDFHLTVEAVKKVFEETKPTPRILLYNNPHNPTGAETRYSVLHEIDELVASYGAVVISDEAYRDQILIDDEDSTRVEEAKNYKIRVGTFSKFVSIPGERLGFVEAREDVIKKVSNYRSNHGGNPPVAGMIYALGMLQDPEWDDFRKKSRQLLRDKHEHTWGIFRKHGLDFTKPEGAFYIYLHLPEVKDANEFSKRLLNEEKVAILPGTAFDPTEHPEQQHYFRLALGVVTLEETEEAAKRIKRQLGKL